MEYINRCTDKNEPTEERPYIIPYELYFASEVKRWDGKGVAFINDNKTGTTLGRAYKITFEQFKEIQKFESREKYEKIIRLGELDYMPVFTFTSPFVRTDIKEACNQYLETIRNGLKETYFDKTELVLNVYLYGKNLTVEDVGILSFLRNSVHGVEIGSINYKELCLTKIIPMIKRLYYYGFIVQDRRSIRQGHDPLGCAAVVYTSKDKRELSDILILMNENK